MRLNKLMVPAVAVVLAVTACGDGGDESDDSANGEQASDESTDDADESADTADSEDDGGAEDEPAEDEPAEEEPAEDESGEDESGGAADGEEVDAVELFTRIAEAMEGAGSFEMTATVDDATGGGSVTGAMQYGSDEFNMRMTIEAQGQESTVLIIDGQFFIEMTEEMAIPGVEAGWMTFGSGEDMFGFGETLDDTGAITDFDSMVEDADQATVTRVGSADIDGVATTEYEVVDGANDITSTMWIDGDDLIRRTVSEGSTVDFFNFGVDVNIEAPPEDDVVDMAEMLGGADQ